MKQKRILAVFSVLSCLAVVFIFCQSLMSPDTSYTHSGRLMALLQQLLDPRGRIDEEVFHLAVRKTAHFLEFAVLGLCVGGTAISVCNIKGQRYVSLPMLATVLVALADEGIQHFTGRSSKVYDVILDFSGAMTGLLLAMLAMVIWKKRKRKRHETGS